MNCRGESLDDAASVGQKPVRTWLPSYISSENEWELLENGCEKVPNWQLIRSFTDVIIKKFITKLFSPHYRRTSLLSVFSFTSQILIEWSFWELPSVSNYWPDNKILWHTYLFADNFIHEWVFQVCRRRFNYSNICWHRLKFVVKSGGVSYQMIWLLFITQNILVRNDALRTCQFSSKANL